MREREFVLFMALVSMSSALAIDMMLPAFGEMRATFDLAPDSTQMSLTVTLFFFGTAVGYVLWGPLADALGRKRVLWLSLTLYAASALVAAFAQTLTVLFVARFVWGIAASGPRVLTQAIVRDKYLGTGMARIMTLVQTAFMLGPILAPLMGRLLIEVGSWRWIMAFGTINSTAVLIWSRRLEETLPPEQRRGLEPRQLAAGFRAVLGNRVTLFYGLSVMFGFGAFYSFLASGELIFSSVYDREELFVPFFVTVSILFAGVAFSMNRILQRSEARPVGIGAGSWYAINSIIMLVVIAANDGLPNFWVWVVLFVITNAGMVAFFPIANSLALEPMGKQAGMATAALGFMAATVGAVLGNQIDRRIDDTVWAIGVGYALFASIALVMQLIAARAAAQSQSASSSALT